MEGGSWSGVGVAVVAVGVGEGVVGVRKVWRRNRVCGEHGEGESVAERVGQGW